MKRMRKLSGIVALVVVLGLMFSLPALAGNGAGPGDGTGTGICDGSGGGGGNGPNGPGDGDGDGDGFWRRPWPQRPGRRFLPGLTITGQGRGRVCSGPRLFFSGCKADSRRLGPRLRRS